MAKKMTKAELDAYFAEVLSRYNDTPIAAYFEKDITAILESAQSGAKKSLKVAEKQEIYNNLAQMVSALDNKIVGYLGELKDNLTNDGATSTLGGTFYYRSNEGDAKANEIIAAVDAARSGTSFEEKANGFDRVMNLFGDYVDNSKLVDSLDQNDGTNAKKNNASLSRIYSNALEVEKTLKYRNENSEIYKLLDRPTQATLRKETAAPFKYYTVLAGIKTGKIKKLTPQHISDLQWVYQNNPGLFPKGSKITNPALKTDEGVQKELLESLKTQHDEKVIREELIKYKAQLSSNPEIMAAFMDNTRAFRVGQNTLARNAKRAGIALGGAGIFVGIQVFAGILPGMADPSFAKVAGQLIADGRIWNTLIPVMTATGADIGVNAFASMLRNRPFNKKFNEINRTKLVEYLYKNRSKWNTQDKEERKTFRKEMVEYVNKNFDNLLGYGRTAERNLDTLMRGIAEQERTAHKRERKASSRIRGEGVELSSITGKRDIEDFAKNIGLSADNPLSKVMGEALSRLGITPSRRAPAFATAPVEDKVDTLATGTERTVDETPVSTREQDIDEALKFVKENIQEELIALDMKIGEVTYEVRVQKEGKKGDVKLTTTQLDRALNKIRGGLTRGVSEMTATAEAHKGTIPVIKKQVGGGKVHISVKKKDDSSKR